jgi:hypothetical protein
MGGTSNLLLSIVQAGFPAFSETGMGFGLCVVIGQIAVQD